MRFKNYYHSVREDIASPAEEWANVITHGLGLLLVLAGIPFMLQTASNASDSFRITGSLAFGAGLLLVYLFSTLYHLANRPALRRWMRTLDHAAIYVLIAGTYTPFILLFLRNSLGYSLLIGLWVLTGLGFIFKIFATHKFRFFSTAVYVAMGWAGVLILKPMLQSIPGPILLCIALGGVAYTIGAVIYLYRKIPYYHAIWHLLVLAGSVSHFIGVVIALRHPVVF